MNMSIISLGKRLLGCGVAVVAATLCLVIPDTSFARDLTYQDSEVTVRVTPGEPTQINFPSRVMGGTKKKGSTLSIQTKDNSMIIFANEAISENGEVVIVGIDDKRSYSVRIAKATADQARDDIVNMIDRRSGALVRDEDEPAYIDRGYENAPPTQVAGLMRELVLAAEFGKQAIPGYRISDQHRGEEVLNDGAIAAKISRIFVGSELWGYELDVKNLLEQTQRLNPAAFRIDGTRMISASNWELSPIPLNTEQQLSGRDKAKVYIITRARK